MSSCFTRPVPRRMTQPVASAPFAYHPPMPERLFRYAHKHRLTHERQFEAVYAGKTRQSRGPLTVFAIPNDLGIPRLGLSVGKRVGTAPRRNRVKRLLREAFRLMQHDLPTGYDLVINVRPHEELILAEYQRIL